MAIAPIACAAPDARTAPPAPALMAGSAGMDPAVIKIALMTLMALGCSLVMYSSAAHAFSNQRGAWVTVVTAIFSWSQERHVGKIRMDVQSVVLERDGVGGLGVPLAITTAVSDLLLGGMRRWI